MTGQLPNPPAEAPPGPAGTTNSTAQSARPHARFALYRSTWLVRRLGAVAPLAAAYASFQAVLSSLPPSLSYNSVHYLLAVSSGVAVGGVVGCAVLITRKPGQRADATPELTQVAGKPPAEPVVPRSLHIGTLLRDCQQTLLDTVVSFNDPREGLLTGWPHFLHEAAAGYRPTSFGTAYGLKLSTALGDQDGRLDRAALTDTLWKLRRPDGGWAARTQGTTGRPELTAIVLGALTAAGCDPARLAESIDVFEAMIAPGVDPALSQSTYVTATVTRELSRIRPGSPRLTEMRTRLLDNAVHDARRDNLTCWSARLDHDRSSVPSSAHTALALVALARVRRVRGDDARLRSAMEQGVCWLVQEQDLAHTTEQIRRVITADHWESLTVSLFTAAWSAKAILESGMTDVPGVGQLLENAIQSIMRGQHSGIWEWDNGNRPIWMTYQGISAVRSFALSDWIISEDG